MPKPKVEIADWSKLQHFKDRSPVWVKLYMILRHDRRWRRLTGDAAKLYIDLILLSADDEPFGSIMLLPEDLAWEVRLTLPELLGLLTEVASSGLIGVVGYHADIKMLSGGDQDVAEVLSLAGAVAPSREVYTEYTEEKEKKETTSPKKANKSEESKKPEVRRRFRDDTIYIKAGLDYGAPPKTGKGPTIKRGYNEVLIQDFRDYAEAIGEKVQLPDFLVIETQEQLTAFLEAN